MIFSKKWAVSRLRKIRQRFRDKRKKGRKIQQNAVETLFQQVAQIPTLKYVGNNRSRDNAIAFPRGRIKYPDFRFTDQNKVIEVIGTYSHNSRYSKWLATTYDRLGIETLIVTETEIVNNPQHIHNRAVNFYGQCTICGRAIQTMGTEPPNCPKCGII